MSKDIKYQKQRLIGSGDRVDVYLGLNVAFGRKVAIKELRGGVETSITERNAFFSEYDKWAKLEHPRIARIEDLDRTRAWVIQEYLSQSILDMSAELSSNPTAAFTALEQILEGLTFLHQTGFVHFNLKASNVRAADGSVKLCDGRCIPIGFPGALPKPRGSNRYLAPEMINEEFGNVGTATDIYVAGMIMLESLSGAQFESLFKGYILGTPDTEIGWVRWHNSPETLDPIQVSLPYVPAPLASLIDGMICKQVAVRYASAERLLTELRSQRDSIINYQPVSSAAPRNKTQPSAPQAPGSSPNPVAAPNNPVHGGTQGTADNKLKLIDRPQSPTYVRCMSGTLAGTLFPTAMGEILIGEGSHCNVRISADHCPLISGREVKIWLGNNGWQISDSLNHPLIVDSKSSFQTANLRSGSIFRLSPRGPDFQFVVQGEHESTWHDIALQLDLTGSHAKATSRSLDKRKPETPSPGPAPLAKPIRAVEAAPIRSQPAAPARAHSAAPVSPPAAPSAPGRPSSSAPVAPGKMATDTAIKPSLAERWNAMDKNKRNNLILFISLPFLAILIILFMPQSKSATPADEDKTGEVEQRDDTPKSEGTPEANQNSNAEKETDPEKVDPPSGSPEPAKSADSDSASTPNLINDPSENKNDQTSKNKQDGSEVTKTNFRSCIENSTGSVQRCSNNLAETSQAYTFCPRT